MSNFNGLDLEPVLSLRASVWMQERPWVLAKFHQPSFYNRPGRTAISIDGFYRVWELSNEIEAGAGYSGDSASVAMAVGVRGG
jgi:hypothetical protein